MSDDILKLRGKKIQITNQDNNFMPSISGYSLDSVLITWTKLVNHQRSSVIVEKLNLISGDTTRLLDFSANHKEFYNSTVTDTERGFYYVTWGQKNWDDTPRLFLKTFSKQGYYIDNSQKTLDSGKSTLDLPDIQLLIHPRMLTVFSDYKNNHNKKYIEGHVYSHDNYDDGYYHNFFYKQGLDFQDSPHYCSRRDPKAGVFSSSYHIVSWLEECYNVVKITAQIFDKWSNRRERFDVVSNHNVKLDHDMAVLSNNNIVFAWHENFDSRSQIVTKIFNSHGGVVNNNVETGSVLISNNDKPKIISGDDYFFVAWTSLSPRSGLYVQKFLFDGTEVGKACLAVAISNLYDFHYSAKIIENNFVLAWHQNTGINNVFIGYSDPDNVCSTLTDTGSATLSLTATHSQSPTISNSQSKSISNSQSVSLSQSNSISNSISGTQSQSLTDSESKSISESLSASLSKSISESQSVSGSLSQSISESKSGSLSQSISKSESNSVSLSQSESLSKSQSQTVSLRCENNDGADIDIQFYNIRLLSEEDVEMAEPYTIVANKTLRNSLSHSVQFGPELVIDHETKDYIDSIYKEFENNDYILKGRVAYTNKCENDILSYRTEPGTDKDSLIKEAYTTQILSDKSLVRNYCLAKWNHHIITQKADVVLQPNQCVNVEMKAEFKRGSDVNYLASGRFSAINKFGKQMLGDEVATAFKCIFKDKHFDFAVISDNKFVDFNMTGVIHHTKPGHVTMETKECGGNNLPQIIANLVYHNFNYSIPSDLSPYQTTVYATKDVINNKKYGAAVHNVELNMDIPLENRINVFESAIKSNNLVLKGEVHYQIKTSYTSFTYNNEINGYKLRHFDKDHSHEWINGQNKKIVGSSMWDNAEFKDSTEITLVPKQCSKAVMAAQVFKDVPVNFTSLLSFSATSKSGYPVVGNELEAVAREVFHNDDFTLVNDNEIVMEVSGTGTQTMIGKVNTMTEDCN